MAYDLNGTNQRLTPSSAPVTGPPFTMACWFNTDNVTALRALLTLTVSTSNNQYETLYLAGNVANDPLRILSNANNIIVTTTAGVTQGQWHHGCFVASATNSRKVFLDGGNSASSSSSYTPVGINTFDIGCFKNLSTEFFDGRMAEVGIWNVGLADDEVTSLAKGMTCDKVRPQSLVFYAPLVRDLIDAKGGLTITNNNTATVANHPRVYA